MFASKVPRFRSLFSPFMRFQHHDRRRRTRIFSKDFSAKCFRRARLSVGFSREVNRARKFVLVLPYLVYALASFKEDRAGRQKTTLYDTHVPLSKSAGWTIINQPTNKLPSHGGGTERTFDLWASILTKITPSQSRRNDESLLPFKNVE